MGSAAGEVRQDVLAQRPERVGVGEREVHCLIAEVQVADD
jgi:hypothetical protein